MRKIECPIILMGIKHCGKSTLGKMLADFFGVEFFDIDELIEEREGKSPREIYNTHGKKEFMRAEKNACANLVEKFCFPKNLHGKKNARATERLHALSSSESRNDAAQSLQNLNGFFNAGLAEGASRTKRPRNFEKPSAVAGGGAYLKSCVVSTGGGICENDAALKILRPFGKIVFLQISKEIACERVFRDADFSSKIPQHLPAYIAKKNPATRLEAQKIFHQFFERRTKQYKKIADVAVLLDESSKEENLQKILKAL